MILTAAVVAVPSEGRNVAANGSLLCCSTTAVMLTENVRVNSATLFCRVETLTHALDWPETIVSDVASGT